MILHRKLIIWRKVFRVNHYYEGIHQEIRASNAQRQFDHTAAHENNSNGMLGFLGMASPNFIADSLMYKLKQKQDGFEPSGSVGMYQIGGNKQNQPNEIYDCKVCLYSKDKRDRIYDA